MTSSGHIVEVTLFNQGGPFGYDAGILRGPRAIKVYTNYKCTKKTIWKSTLELSKVPAITAFYLHIHIVNNIPLH